MQNESRCFVYRLIHLLFLSLLQRKDNTLRNTITSKACFQIIKAFQDTPECIDMLKVNNHKENVINNIKALILGVFTLICASACNPESKRDFEWREDIAQLTGRDLAAWLRKAPFEHELKQESRDSMVITNAMQVFPFMGKYYSTVDELDARGASDTSIYQQEAVLYQDAEWGDVFVHAMLLNDDTEVFLNDFYSTSGNVMLGGMGAGLDTYTASLKETEVITSNDRYKAGLYWARTSGKSYLLAFYQQGQLVFESIAPLHQADTTAALKLINQVATALGLPVSEWENAHVNQLMPQPTRKSFWKDPFVSIYPDEDYVLLNKVKLKIKDTPFKAVYPASKGDYYFSYTSTSGEVSLYTRLLPLEGDKETFEAGQEGASFYDIRYAQKLFYQQEGKGDKVRGTAKVYFGAGQCLEIRYAYPAGDPVAKDNVHGVLKNLQVSRIL